MFKSPIKRWLEAHDRHLAANNKQIIINNGEIVALWNLYADLLRRLDELEKWKASVLKDMY